MSRTSDSPDAALLLRRCTCVGRPFGGEDFVGQLEQHFQRSRRRWALKN